MSAKRERSLTIVESILIAAAALDGERRTFSAEDLVVRAWELFPDKFGLQGYADRYPDSNRVLTKIMGASSGLKTRGWLERVGVKKYRLSEGGREAAQQLAGTDSEVRLAAVPRQFVNALRRMLNSTVYDKFGKGEDLTFSDAAAFWNISARSTANQLNLRLNEVRSAIECALRSITSEQGNLPGSSQVISQKDLHDLSRLSNSLEKQFARELDVIRARTNERYV